MEDNWVDFFKSCIDELHVGSCWAITEKALAYIKSDEGKEIFLGCDTPEAQIIYNNVLGLFEKLASKNRIFSNWNLLKEQQQMKHKTLSNYAKICYDFFQQAINQYRTIFEPTFKALQIRASKLSGLEHLEEKLVGYYADRAMIDLDENLSFEEKIDRKIAVEKKINDLRNTMFSWLVSRASLSIKEQKHVLRIALSSNIDVATKQLWVSALTISCMEYFDMPKFFALLDIWEQSEDSKVQIRALVGMMLCLQYIPRLFESDVKDILCVKGQSDPAFMSLILNACKVELHARNKQEGKMAFTKQLFSTLMENTKMLIKDEAEEDDFDDDDDDDKSEEMSNSMIEEVFELMEGGTDIYFSQFKNKKGTVFFHSLYNWFMPFSRESVAYLRLLKKAGEENDGILFSFLDKGHMCDNDQYSFVSILSETKMNLSKSLGQLKEQVSEIRAEHGDFGSEDEYEDEAMEVREAMKKNPKKIIHQIICYLHDLSRFYELAPMRSSFSNPFEEDDNGCLMIPLTSNLMDDSCFFKFRLRMARYCFKREMSQYIPDLLMEDYPDTAECHFMLADAHFHLYCDDCEGSELGLPHADWLMEHEPDNFLFCAIAANIYSGNHCDVKVERCWRKAIEVAGDNESQELDAKASLAAFYFAHHKFAKATKLYYELNYRSPSSPLYITFLVSSMLLEHPGDKATVRRALEMLHSYEENHSEPDPFASLFNDKEALAEDNFAKSFSKFLGSMSEYMQQDHSMDCKLKFLEGLCKWVLIGEQDDDAENKYNLEDVINLIYEEYHDKALSLFKHHTADEYITVFEDIFVEWLRSFGISELDLSIVNEMMRQKFNKVQDDTKKMLEDIKNGKFK